MLFIDNATQAKAISVDEALGALRASLSAYQRGDALRRPRLDNIIPASRPKSFFDFSSMEGGDRGGYFALRIKPDIREFPDVMGGTRMKISDGTLEGGAGISAGMQGIQFSAVAGKIYENVRARDSAQSCRRKCMSKIFRPNI